MNTSRIGFYAAQKIAGFASRNVADVLNLAKVDDTFNEVIVDYADCVWKRVLTREAIYHAFQENDLFLIRKAYALHLPYDYTNAFVKGHCSEEVNAFFINEGFLDKVNNTQITALYWCILSKNAERAKRLINAGCKLDDCKDSTYLILASMIDLPEWVK